MENDFKLGFIKGAEFIIKSVKGHTEKDIEFYRLEEFIKALNGFDNEIYKIEE